MNVQSYKKCFSSAKLICLNYMSNGQNVKNSHYTGRWIQTYAESDIQDLPFGTKML